MLIIIVLMKAPYGLSDIKRYKLIDQLGRKSTLDPHYIKFSYIAEVFDNFNLHGKN